MAFRKTLYESIDQLQDDLDRYLAFYNRERAHQGYRTQGRTPYQAFVDGKAAAAEGSGEEVNSAARSVDKTSAGEPGTVRGTPANYRTIRFGAPWTRCSPSSSASGLAADEDVERRSVRLKGLPAGT